jgi:hypothetical protein
MTLSDRMKRYEQPTDLRLVRRMPAIIRIDGKAFHTLRKEDKMWPAITATITIIFFLIAIPFLIKRKLEDLEEDRKIADMNLQIYLDRQEKEKDNVEN